MNNNILSPIFYLSVASLIFIIITSCSTHRIIAPQKCPEPVIYPEPDYPIKRLTEADKANPGKVTQAWVVSYKQCMMQLNLYKMQVKGYKHA